MTAQVTKGDAVDLPLIVTMTAADAANKQMVRVTPGMLILVQNTGAGARNYTVTSVADSRGRTNDLGSAIAAGAIHILGPFKSDGWRQAADGQLYFEADNAEVKFAVIRNP